MDRDFRYWVASVGADCFSSWDPAAIACVFIAREWRFYGVCTIRKWLDIAAALHETAARIHERYHWTGIWIDISQYILSCVTCQ